MPEWTLIPGEKIKRTELHQLFGGGGQSGISPSAQTPNVLIFSDLASGKQHGYIDTWKDDGCFHYVGHGKRGDQEMNKGNRAILESAQQGRTLRVFKGVGGVVEYKGQFVLDSQRPWYTTDAPETGGGPLRSVIVFCLRPVGTQPNLPAGLPAIVTQDTVVSVPIEDMYTEKMIVEPSREPYEAERRESQLVQRFKAFMLSQKNVIERLMITPSGEAKPIFSDIYIKNRNILVEAKGGVDRCSIRMAIGQLVDYSRFASSGVKCAVLLPSIPRHDLMKLLVHAGVFLYVPEGKKFVLMDGNENRVWV
jgi:hypothetical protein